MNLHFKFVKPTSFYPVADGDINVINRFNNIGALSWDRALKDGVGFEDGDISTRARVKKEIKSYLTLKQESYCYYCGRSFYLFGENQRRISRNIHIDHILPKNANHGHYGRFVFEPKNLILACAICNGADFKGRLDFCNTPTLDYDRMSFLIVHPHFDDINQHFVIGDDGRAIKINQDTSKADLMERVFGINSTHMIEQRLQNLFFIRQNLNRIEESEIQNITQSIPTEGLSSL